MLILSWLPKRPICPLRQSGTILGHLVGADSAQPFFSSQRLSRNSEAVHAEPLHSSEQTARNSFFLRSGVRATPSFAEAVHTHNPFIRPCRPHGAPSSFAAACSQPFLSPKRFTQNPFIRRSRLRATPAWVGVKVMNFLEGGEVHYRARGGRSGRRWRSMAMVGMGVRSHDRQGEGHGEAWRGQRGQLRARE